MSGDIRRVAGEEEEETLQHQQQRLIFMGRPQPRDSFPHLCTNLCRRVVPLRPLRLPLVAGGRRRPLLLGRRRRRQLVPPLRQLRRHQHSRPEARPSQQGDAPLPLRLQAR